MASPRILLCGDVHGRLGQLFKCVSSVTKSAGPFDELLCVGQFFPDSPERLEEFMDYVGVLHANEWPNGVTNRATTDDIPLGISDSSGSDPTVAELVAEIKPCYCIADTKGILYAREPYINVDAVRVTRFLRLASVGNKDKQGFKVTSPAASARAAAVTVLLPVRAAAVVGAIILLWYDWY